MAQLQCAHGRGPNPRFVVQSPSPKLWSKASCRVAHITRWLGGKRSQAKSGLEVGSSSSVLPIIFSQHRVLSLVFLARQAACGRQRAAAANSMLEAPSASLVVCWPAYDCNLEVLLCSYCSGAAPHTCQELLQVLPRLLCTLLWRSWVDRDAAGLQPAQLALETCLGPHAKRAQA